MLIFTKMTTAAKAAVGLGAAACGLLAQTGTITGRVTNDKGLAVAGVFVSAGLRTPPPGSRSAAPSRPFFPVMAKNATDAKGTFEIGKLPAGEYTLCAEAPEAELLNPCMWAKTIPQAVITAEGAQATILIVMSGGTAITIRVADPAGLIASHPEQDDLRVGTLQGNLSFIPARVISRDATGKTLKLMLPPGQTHKLAVQSKNFFIEDTKRVPVTAATAFTVTAPSAQANPAGATTVTSTAATAGASLTLMVTGSTKLANHP